MTQVAFREQAMLSWVTLYTGVNKDNNFQANYADAIAQGLDVFLDLSQSLARCSPELVFLTTH